VGVSVCVLPPPLQCTMDRKASGFKMVVPPTYTDVLPKADDEKGQGKVTKKAKCFLNITF